MPPGKRGRPTIEETLAREQRHSVLLEAEIRKRLLDGLRSGLPVTVACALAGLGGTSSFYRWIKDPQTPEQESFRAEVAAALAEPEARCIALILEAGKKSWQAAAWYLERSHPDRYSLVDGRRLGRKSDPVVADGMADELTDAQLEAEVSRLLEVSQVRCGGPLLPAHDTTIEASHEEE